MDDRRQRFERLVLPHLDAAYNLARWLARSDAEDIVQDAMLRAWRAFDSLHGTDAKPWLLAILRNCHLTAMERKNRHKSVPIDEDEEQPLPATGPSPEDLAVSGDMAKKLDLAIAALPLEFRETLILREMEDLSYREIAEVTGVPIGTVMSRLSRGRLLLRESWLAKTKEKTP